MRRRALVEWMTASYRASVRRACHLSRFSRTAWYRSSQAKDQSVLRRRIREIALSRPRFGYQRIHVMLRREDWRVNRKRVHRLYRLEGLQLRMGCVGASTSVCIADRHRRHRAATSG